MFEEWRKHTRNELQARKVENDKQKTKNKMQKFLEAAAEGKLWTDRQDNSLFENDSNAPTTTRTNRTNTSKNTLRKSKSFESKH